MTVAQLIKKLQSLDADMPVVIRTPSKGFLDDFGDLNTSDLVVINTVRLFNEPYWGKQIYDASEGPRDNPVKVLSLTGGTVFQRGSDEKEG